MIIVQATSEQMTWAKEHTPEMAYRHDGVFEGSWEQRYAGLLAEIIIADTFMMRRTNPGQPDPGYDFIWRGILPVDLKTTRRTVPWRPEYDSNLAARQYRQGTAYLFASLEAARGLSFADVLTVVGILPPGRPIGAFLARAGDPIRRTDGSIFYAPIDFYNIPTDHLEEVWSWGDLAGILDGLAMKAEFKKYGHTSPKGG